MWIMTHITDRINMNQAETNVTTTNITELRGSILIDQLAVNPPELIHSIII